MRDHRREPNLHATSRHTRQALTRTGRLSSRFPYLHSCRVPQRASKAPTPSHPSLPSKPTLQPAISSFHRCQPTATSTSASKPSSQRSATATHRQHPSSHSTLSLAPEPPTAPPDKQPQHTRSATPNAAHKPPRTTPKLLKFSAVQCRNHSINRFCARLCVERSA